MHYGTKGHSGAHSYGSGLYGFQDLRRSGVMDWSLQGKKSSKGRGIVQAIVSNRASKVTPKEQKYKERRNIDRRTGRLMPNYQAAKDAGERWFSRDRVEVKYANNMLPKPEKLKKMRTLNSPEEIATAREQINRPNGDNTDPIGRHFNDANCAIAFEMIERGYHVSARPSENGHNPSTKLMEDALKHGLNLKSNKVVEYSLAPAANLVYTLFANNYAGSFKPIMGDKKIGKMEVPESVTESWREYEKARIAAGRRDSHLDSKIVAALKRSKNGKEALEKFNKYQDEIAKMSDMAGRNTCNIIQKQGDGARGIMLAGLFNGADPSENPTAFKAYNYKNVDGEVRFFDAQASGKALHEGLSASELFYGLDPRDIYVMRTDNRSLSKNVGNSVYSSPKER